MQIQQQSIYHWTGEKPYKCPQCPYAACRRDMITRHMRTHARYEAQRAAAAAVATNQSDVGGQMGKGRVTGSPTTELSKVTIKIEANHGHSSPKASPYAVTDEQLHSYHHHQLNNNNNFLLNHHHLLNHQADDLPSSAASVANTIIKTENTLLKIQWVYGENQKQTDLFAFRQHKLQPKLALKNCK